jgi:hypothetical protein
LTCRPHCATATPFKNPLIFTILHNKILLILNSSCPVILIMISKFYLAEKYKFTVYRVLYSN